MPKSIGISSRALPTPVSSGTQLAPRLSANGDLIVSSLMDGQSALADEGSYYKACTQSTSASVGLRSCAPSGSTSEEIFSPTAAVLAVLNTSSSTRFVFDYIRFMTSSLPTPNTAGISVNYAITTNNYDRYNSGGALQANNSNQLSPVNCSTASSRRSAASIYSGSTTSPLILNAFTGDKLPIHARGAFKHGVVSTAVSYVVGDEYSLDFGDYLPQGAKSTSATAHRYASSTGPLVLGPGHFMAIHVWSAVGTAIFNVDMGWWER